MQKIYTNEIKLMQLLKDLINIKDSNNDSFPDVKEYIRDGYNKRGGRFKMVADDNDEMSFLTELKKIAESLSSEEDKNKLRENFIPNEMVLIHFYENNWSRKKDVYGIEYIISYKTKVKE